MREVIGKYLIGILFVFYSLSAFTSCDKRPDGVISDKQMVNLMADMDLAEGYVDVASKGTDYNTMRHRIADGVLTKHGLTQEQFDSTLLWYGKNIDLYNDLHKKVDKEIERRRKEMMASSGMVNSEENQGSLWPFASHMVISNLGGTDNISFSLPASNLNKGDLLTWKLRLLSSGSDVSGILGVDYVDGAKSIVSRNSFGNHKVEVRLQTDSSRIVSRIFGVFRARHSTALPLFVDSISLISTRIDSSRYYIFQSQPLIKSPLPVMRNNDEAI